MRIAVLTFEGFNELDSFVASAMLNRVKSMQALIVCPTERVASMNGVVVQSQAPLSFAREADAVIVGSGRGTRDVVRDSSLMGELGLDPSRQVIGARVLRGARTREARTARGCPSLHRFHDEAVGRRSRGPGPGAAVRRPRERRHGGGCLASHYLAAWVIARLAGWDAAESIVDYVAPVGQKREYVERARAVVQQYLPVYEPVAV